MVSRGSSHKEQALMGWQGPTSAPIIELCKEVEPDKEVWTKQCQRALCVVKEALMLGLVQVNPDLDMPSGCPTRPQMQGRAAPSERG